MVKRGVGYGQPEGTIEMLNKSREIVSNMATKYEELKERVPADDPVWVADILMEHDYKKVDLYTWEAAHYLFKKNLEHEAKNLMSQGITGIFNKLGDVF